MADRPLVILSGPVHPDAVALLETVAEVRVAPGTDEESLMACLAPADALLLRGSNRITARIMDAAPKLRIIARHGAGVDSVDLEAARERGIAVTNTPGAMTVSVAELTLGLMLAVSRRIMVADRGLRAGVWATHGRCVGFDLAGRTLGVIGYGRIGRRVAEICGRGLGMRIVYSDVQPAPADPDLPALRLPLDELLATADVVTLHVPLMEGTHHLIGRRELGLLKPGAILINASRGPVVDEVALAEALQSGHLGGAGLDVFEEEPVRGVHPLAAFDNVVMTPHIASNTPTAMRAMAVDAAEEILAVLAGREPRNRVA